MQDRIAPLTPRVWHWSAVLREYLKDSFQPFFTLNPYPETYCKGCQPPFNQRRRVSSSGRLGDVSDRRSWVSCRIVSHGRRRWRIR